MALTQEQLANIISHNAATLCNSKGDRKINEHKNSNGGLTDINPNEYSDEWDNFSLSEPSTPTRNIAQTPANPSKQAIINSKLPSAIKESLMEKQIDVSGLGVNASTSFLDKLAEQRQPNFQSDVVEQTTTAPMYQPQIQNYPPQPTYVPQPQIDYNYLKHIVSECIAEYFKQHPLNENALPTLKKIGLSEGKIKLIDNSGNVYSADLEFKGNIEERKREKENK